MKTKLLFLLFLISFTTVHSQTFNDGILEYTVTSGINVAVGKYNNVCLTGSLTIPETVVNNGTTYTITEIRNSAFYNCTNLTSIDLPKSLTNINIRAFYNCNNLTIVEIPNSVINIGDEAFNYCANLTNVNIPDNLTNLGFSAFANSGITSVKIPESLTTINHNTFYNCNNLNDVTLPNTITTIGDYAFRQCLNLKQFNVNWANPLAINTTVFLSTTLANILLTYPTGIKSLYKAAAVLSVIIIILMLMNGIIFHFLFLVSH